MIGTATFCLAWQWIIGSQHMLYATIAQCHGIITCKQHGVNVIGPKSLTFPSLRVRSGPEGTRLAIDLHIIGGEGIHNNNIMIMYGQLEAYTIQKPWYHNNSW